jgi:RNA polymerase sigma-70 factor (ECF subfamily)
MGVEKLGTIKLNASVLDAKDERDLQKVFVKNQSLLKRFVARFFNRPHDIEDIVQETFVKALEAGSKTKILSPKAYLFQTAKNLSIKELSRCSTRLQNNMGDYLPEGVLVTETSTEDQVDNLRKLATFCQALRGLPVQCRRVYILRKVYGFSHKEIASRLGISTNTVERHIAKGILRCAEHMAAFGYRDEYSHGIKKHE